MVQKIWGKVKLMFSLSLVHMFSVLVCMCVFFKESNVFEALAKAGKKRREGKGRMWVLAKAGKVKLMFNLSVVHMSSVLVCMCVLQGKMFWPPGKS